MTELQAAPAGTPAAPRKNLAANLALYATLVPVAAAAVRIWLYSGGDTSLFLVLLRTLNIPTVLIGTVALIIPGTALLGVIVLLTDWKARDWLKEKLIAYPGMVMVMAVMTLGICYTTNWMAFVVLLFIGVLTVAYFLLKNLGTWGRRVAHLLVARKGDRRTPDSLIVIIGSIIGFWVTPNNMWLPLEKIETTTSGSKVVYVLDITSEWTTLLTEDRNIRILPTTEIKSRAVCRKEGATSLATLMYRSDTSDAPDCDWHQ